MASQTGSQDRDGITKPQPGPRSPRVSAGLEQPSFWRRHWYLPVLAAWAAIVGVSDMASRTVVRRDAASVADRS